MFRRCYRLRVNIEIRTKRRMPEQFLHHFELNPHPSQQSGVRVTNRMPPESLLNSDLLRYRTIVTAKVAESSPVVPAFIPKELGVDWQRAAQLSPISVAARLPSLLRATSRERSSSALS